MKYAILQGDGMADYPIEELGGKTPLEATRTPNMDELASRGELGLVKTIPAGYPPGSDVANMGILGYDPRRYYTGRAPLEAAGMGVELRQDDIAFRCNLVTLEEKSGEKRMIDYSAGHLSTKKAKKIIEVIQNELGDEEFQFYPGVSYRHLLVWRGGARKLGLELKLTPPHDISGKGIEEYLPREGRGNTLVELMEGSQEILKNELANSIWLWGEGSRPSMPTLQERRSLSGSIISAVNLIKGLGIYAGMDVIDVPGATGFIDTNYSGKVEAALKSLKDRDLVFVHLEAPDEASHQGDLKMKCEAIENFDAKIVGPTVDGLEEFAEFSLLVLTDHYTPISLKTHIGDAVPFVIYRSRDSGNERADRAFDERSAGEGGLLVEDGHKIMDLLLAANRR